MEGVDVDNLPLSSCVDLKLGLGVVDRALFYRINPVLKHDVTGSLRLGQACISKVAVVHLKANQVRFAITLLAFNLGVREDKRHFVGSLFV